MNRESILIRGTIAAVRLDDGRLLSVIPLTFGRGRLCIGIDELTYEDAW